MLVCELQTRGNAARSLPLASGTPGIGDELSLVAMAKSGHNDAFGELYKLYQRKAYCTALRILRNPQDAEDVVQRAFQRVLVSLQRFREDSTFSTWLTRIVINESLMQLRRRRARQPLHENCVDAALADAGTEIADGRPTPEEILCENERRATVRQAIAELRENLRIVVFHREYQGLSSAETAERLGLTVSAVKARTFHARRFLRKRLERHLNRASALSKLQNRKA
jgi:RNA polymerase sigma-70 factor, ECF subfamily